MPKFWIDFSGYCIIEAPNKKEAKEQFYRDFHLDITNPICNETYEIEGIEEVSENAIERG